MMSLGINFQQQNDPSHSPVSFQTNIASTAVEEIFAMKYTLSGDAPPRSMPAFQVKVNEVSVDEFKDKTAALPGCVCDFDFTGTLARL